MAHFAQIENGIVTNVIVIDNSVLEDESGVEQESLGKKFIADIGLDGEWVQTSYNGAFRGSYAGLGMTYDSVEDRFGPAPTPSIAVNPDTIPADGETAATVTFTDPTEPDSVTFIVNDVEKVVQVTSAGNAFLDVVSRTPGDAIIVGVVGFDSTVEITVEGA